MGVPTEGAGTTAAVWNKVQFCPDFTPCRGASDAWVRIQRQKVQAASTEAHADSSMSAEGGLSSRWRHRVHGWPPWG